MASPAETSLLSALESSDAGNIYELFSAHLQPFLALSNPKKPSKRSSKSAAAAADQSSIRSLAKQFLPFLNRSLGILPKRLCDPSRGKQPTTGLFETYKLCLDCLDLISSQLSCKPYMVDLQRVRLVHCFEACGLYKDAEVEGLGLLERLKRVDFGKKVGKVEGMWLPCVEKGGGDDVDFVLLVVEVVVTLVKCTAMGKSKVSGDYRRVLDLVEEVRPWFRKLDAATYEKLHRVLVTYLGKCALFLVGEVAELDDELLRAFCVEALTKYAESSMKDQIYKFACRICSSLFSQQEIRSSVATDLLICALDSAASQCKVEREVTRVEFVELVSYCANKCRASTASFHKVLAAHIYKISGDFHKVLVPLEFILRLYATGLYFTDCSLKFKNGDFTSSRCVVYEFVGRILLDDRERLHSLVSSLKSAKSYFSMDCSASYRPYCVERKNSDGRIYSHVDFHSEASRTCPQKSTKAYLLPYLNALKFLCQPLADSVNSERKLILGENEDAGVSTDLCHIQDTLHQFCDALLFHNHTSQEGDGFDANNKIILSVAVAAFTLSVRTQLKMKESVDLIKHIIASEWIQPHGLKFLFASLYNVGIILYRNKQMKEASKALKLSCRASWTCVELLCRHINKSNDSNGDLTEDALLEFLSDVCSKSTFLLDVLHQHGSNKAKRKILFCLESWSVAGNLLKKLPAPKLLVKQWVKMECKVQKITDVEECSPTLYCSLSSSAKVSKRTLGILLEEELSAYEEMAVLCPQFSQRMQMKIIDILLQNVYVTHDFFVEKARILIRKGKALKTLGEGLKDCIQCLSEAIYTMKDMQGERYGSDIPRCHQLAVAYSLRALSTHEAEPNSKQVFEDINAAINLWLSIPFPDHCFDSDQQNIVSRSTMILLYNIIDLSSMKGCVDFHKDIYQLMLRFFKWKNVSPETCLAALWEWRRLSHALCISPVNESFITSLSEQCGELSKSIDFWIHCFNGSKPLEVGFKQSLSLSLSVAPSNSLGHDSFCQSDITLDDIKGTALELISAGSSSQVKPSPLFVAGYLYYDLCERFISKGQLSEALSYAKEAHRLRTKLFQEKFVYSVEQHSGKDKETGEIIQKHTYGISTLQVVRSVVKEVLSFDAGSWDLEGYLSPWKVLQCYLESTLQVGVIHELIGNGAEAETFLLWGKNISCSQSLSLFIVAFSSVLGKLYRKKQLWDLAEKELLNAKRILVNDSAMISCLKCRLLQEVTIDQQLGDLSLSQLDGTKGSTSERSSTSEDLYRSALDKLGLPEWKNLISYPKEADTHKEILKNLVNDVEDSDSNSCACSTSGEAIAEFLYKKEGPKAKTEGKRSRKDKNSLKPLAKEPVLNDTNSRITRSRYRSSQSQSVNVSGEVQTGRPKQSNSNHVSDIARQERLLSVVKSSVVNSDGEVTCICNGVGCWLCLLSDVMKSGLLTSFINVKWEFVRRQSLLRVLAGIGKCLGSRGLIHEAHEISLQSISALVSRNQFHHAYSSACSTFLLNLLGKEISGDILAVERAAALYNICWLYLKYYYSKDARISCCILSDIQLPNIVSWLKLAFILCCEVPALFQKVSRLLAVIHLLSTSMESSSLPTCKEMSGHHWASYFHQASVGTHLNHQLFLNMTVKHTAEHLITAEGSHASTTCTGVKSCNPLRLAPESVQDLESFVMDFFGSLPCSTVICISMLGGDYACLLQELLSYPSQVHAWMLLSRFSSKNQPVVVLLPVDSILEDVSNDDDNDEGSNASAKIDEGMNSDKHWHCPWRYAIVDDVAPAFKHILEENYLSSSVFPSEDTKRNRTLWWTRRKKLDHRLGTLLRNLEESWLGPWKYMLLGEWSNYKLLDSVNKKVVCDLRSKCKLDVDENLIRAILGGVRNSSEMEACIPQLCSNKGRSTQRYGFCDNESCGTLSYTSNEADNLSTLVSQLLCEAVNDLEKEDSVNREPIILVPDCEVQMLPWENLPILRNHEVYRMPSVGSILASLDRSRHHQEQTGSLIAAFPLIDPLDAFYLLNPSGDLSSTQAEFEKWFRDQNLEGKAGFAPTAEELAVALKSHDLFIYFGHGSGAQYIPKHEIQKLDNCAATLLMGCSSGSLSLNGSSYIPQGAPLSYLLAGSPVTVANLWEVTDKDIDRFAKAMLDAWLTERSSCSTSCLECSSVAKEFEAMTIKSCKANGKKVMRKKAIEDGSGRCEHRPKIGSFMGRAREACTLPYLIGAAPVCYGVPTGIRRKDL